MTAPPTDDELQAARSKTDVDQATKSVVVTGVGRGLGAAIATRLMDDGYFVVGIEARPEGAELDGDGFPLSGHLVPGDAADEDVVEAAAWAATSDGRQLAGWVNNAAVAIRGTLHQFDRGGVEEVLRVNLLGVLLGASVAVQTFLRQRSAGSIVNISSIQGQAGFPGWAAYAAAKGGVDALTRYLAVEYGPVGIRANAVAPGNIRTALSEEVIRAAPDPEEMERIMSAMHPLGRIGEAPEVAAVVAFLLSTQSSLITGEVIAVDGGALARCYPMPVSADLIDRGASA